MAFDLIKFNDDTSTIMTEKVDQEVKKFNEASRGAIVLRSGRNRGDFKNESFFKSISGLVRRRNANGSGDVAGVRLGQSEQTSVKVAAGTPPIAFEPQQYNWIQQNPELAAVKIGEQLATAKLQDMLNTAIKALVAAIKDDAVKHDAKAAVANLGVLNSGAAKLGDRSGQVLAWVMHSKVVHDVYSQALGNSNRLFEFGTVNVREDGFGRVFVVTDSPALLNKTPSPNEYSSLGLTSEAVLVEPNGDFYATIQETTGKENIVRTYQAEWTYNVGLKGYTWDKTNGGSSPNDTALGTSTNWDKIATSFKDTAGVRVITQ